MHPDVGAIVVHEDGDIAYDANVALAAVAAQLPPLLVKGKLEDAAHAQIISKFFTGFGQGRRLTVGKIMGPTVPAREFVPGAEAIEQNEVIEPPGIFGAERFEALQRFARRRSQKAVTRFVQEWHLVMEYVVVVDRSGGGVQALNLRPIDPAL